MLDRTTPPSIQSVSLTFHKPTKRILRNGTPVHIMKASELGAIRIDFVFSVGQYQQARNLQANFTCRMLREGCRGYTAAEFAERLDYYGAWLELNTVINRTFVTLYTLKKHFSATVELVHRMLTEPIYNEEQLRIVCDNNKAHFLINLQKGNFLAMRNLRHSIYGDNHPCGVQTRPEDFDTLQVEDIVNFHHHYYGSSTCQIYLSGEVDEEQLSCVESLFGNEKWGASEVDNESTIQKIHLPINPNIHPTPINIKLDGAVQESIHMGCLLMDVNSPDYLSMRVLTTVLGGYFGSRLMKNIREEKGYTYHIGADLMTNTSQVMFIIHCEAQIGKSEEIINEIHREMYRLQTELIPDDELCMVRNYMIGEFCRNYESAFALSDAYIFLEHFGLPVTHLEDTINSIHTTDASRLQQLAQQYLRPENLHCVVVHS